MVDKEKLLEVLEIARQRMIDDNGDPVLLGWNRKIMYYFSDIDEYWTMVVEEGVPEEPVQEEIFDPDIRIRTTAELFIKLMRGEMSGLRAMTTGKVKIKASMADMKDLKVFM